MTTKNLTLLMCVLVFSIAFQFCRADDDDLDKGEVYQKCYKDCDDKCKGEGYGEVFCHMRCNKPCEAKQKMHNVNETFRAVNDTKNFLKKSISGATTDRILSSGAQVSMVGIFMLVLLYY
ncbi:hypothetical protein MKW94_018906 [Papaver nudicaule]|uniref:Uncharacterized protein n=1 Tax=Papaver nudicaule TaxID=74823 RepID=A0AA41S9R7_PAPNU|nr:hypothetical protein [Papaver nudicaule]